MTTEKNMKLWHEVCETNPDHTKEVTFGRGFTAIDPMQQVKNATEQFGPAGEGWGWEVVDTKFLPTDFVACLVRLTTGHAEFIEQWGQCGLFIDKAKEKPDGDCMKKATTDGMTKCLSYLGFNADVFLGKFADNRYVAEMMAKYSGLTAKEKAGELEKSIALIQATDNLEAAAKVYKAEYVRLEDIGADLKLLEYAKDSHKEALQKAGSEPLEGQTND